MDNVVWMVLLIGFVIVSAATEKTAFLCFAGSALGALVISMLGAPVFPQILVFLIILIFTMFFTQPALVKRIIRKLARRSNTPARRKK